MSDADLFAAARTRDRGARPPREPAPPRQIRTCAVCGGPAAFGFGVALRRGHEGRWACRAHRDQVEAMAQ